MTKGKAELEFEKWLTKYYGDTFMLADGSELPIIQKVEELLAAQRREWVGRIREVRENIKGWYGGRNKVGQPVVTRVSVLKALADILKDWRRQMIDYQLRRITPNNASLIPSDWQKLPDSEKIELLTDKLIEIITELNRVSSIAEMLAREPIKF